MAATLYRFSSAWATDITAVDSTCASNFRNERPQAIHVNRRWSNASQDPATTASVKVARLNVARLPKCGLAIVRTHHARLSVELADVSCKRVWAASTTVAALDRHTVHCCHPSRVSSGFRLEASGQTDRLRFRPGVRLHRRRIIYGGWMASETPGVR